MNEGKRGPKGGVIDIDDPREILPAEALYPHIHYALSLCTFAAQERIAGREQNESALLHRAALRLARGISDALPNKRKDQDG